MGNFIFLSFKNETHSCSSGSCYAFLCVYVFCFYAPCFSVCVCIFSIICECVQVNVHTNTQAIKPFLTLNCLPTNLFFRVELVCLNNSTQIQIPFDRDRD